MKTKDQESLNSAVSAKVDHVFLDEKIWKLSFRVVLPSLLFSLLLGVFVFSDQILMNNLIPKDMNIPIVNGEKLNYYQVLVDALGTNQWNDVKTIIYGTPNVIDLTLNQDLIRPTVSSIGVVNLVIMSMGLFISTGGSILYTRSLAQHKNLHKTEIFRTAFYGSIISSLIFTLILIFVQSPILHAILPDPNATAIDSANKFFDPSTVLTPDQEALKSQMPQETMQAVLIKYYNARNTEIVKLSNDYLFFLSGSIILISLINLFVFLLRSEAHNLWITIFSVVGNTINIILDFVFLRFGKMAMLGSGLATFIGYFINLIAIIVYIVILNRRQLTDINFYDLRKCRIHINIFVISFLLGVGAFLRNLSLAIANILYLQIWQKTVSITGDPNILVDAGAVSAGGMYNLFFFAIFGIIDGMRPILGFNYTKQNYARTKKIFYWGLYISLGYAILANAITYTATFINIDSNHFLDFLGAIGPDGKLDPGRVLILRLLIPSMMLQLPFLAFAVSGLSLFQSTSKMWMNIFLSVIQGFITFFPIVYSVSAISIAVGSWQLMFFGGFINIAISSLIIFALALVYMYKYMGKKEKYNDPEIALTDSINALVHKFSKKNVAK